MFMNTSNVCLRAYIVKKKIRAPKNFTSKSHGRKYLQVMGAKIWAGPFTSVGFALRERNKGLMVNNCADDNLSRPSAQHEDKVGKQDRRRHI
jgi:hypothetical protein